MDFFEHQERARRKTGLLIFYFILALLGITAAIYGLAMIILFASGEASSTTGDSIWRPSVWIATSVATLAVVFLASGYKTMQLSGGGKVVARELGGRELDTNTVDYHERRLLNVVEEMAIASGVPVPTVYVMDRQGSINAFAAGKTTSDAVIGVTRGCMTLLTRDELQGVIAHEFSHILNGDMRLNIRLMGILFGILFLALMGELILRFGLRGSLQSGRREGVGMALIVLIVGVGLLAVGYIGSFFAKLIKASISRQREFLADASAVQFTRNPDGLAGALIKIGGHKSGASIDHPMAEDASHLFFGSVDRASLLATHPPLATRIKRLLPYWDGMLVEKKLRPVSHEQDERLSKSANGPVSSLVANGHSKLKLTEQEASESLRSLHPEQVELGSAVHQTLPNHWVKPCRNPIGAQAVVYALLLTHDESTRSKEMELLRRNIDEETLEITTRLYTELYSAHSTVKLSLVDLAIPSLRHLSLDEFRNFRNLIHQLIAADRQVNLFEYTLQQVVIRHLDIWFGLRNPPRIKYRSLRGLADEAGILLSSLAALGSPDDEAQASRYFEAAISPLKGKAIIPRKSGVECGLNQIEKALIKLDQATPTIKRELLEACARSVLVDGALSSRESELIRAIADAIGCGIPPFVKTAPLV
ncbi:MAG: M48 family metallopeptidase [Verrucomicrobiota bacterium]